MTTRTVMMLKWAVVAALTVSSFQALGQNGAGAALNRASQKLDAKFAAADKDRDGYVTLEEAKNGNMTTTVKYFAEIDTTHRGKVSKDEIKHFMIQRASEHAATP